MLAINIDTSRISKLALAPCDPDHLLLVRELERGSTYLIVCFTRIRELTRIDPDSKRRIVAFLRNVPTLLGQPESVLEESELAAGCALAVGTSPAPARPFALESSDWGSSDHTKGQSAADILEMATPQITQDGRLRSMADAADYAARALGPRAAVVLDRTAPARAALSRHLEHHRATLGDYGSGLSAGQVFNRAGGLSGFPSLQVVAELRAARLAESNPAARNDMFDEDIARFHPYSAVSIFDHATTARFWRARVPGFERVVSDVSRAPEVVDRVRCGELLVGRCAVPGVS